jgi:hypothetical protein
MNAMYSFWYAENHIAVYRGFYATPIFAKPPNIGVTLSGNEFLVG